MLVANIKRILGLGSLLVLFLSANLAIELKAAEAAGVVNPYAALSQAEKNTALLEAAREGHAEVVRLLLAAEADVNAQTQAGVTSLMWAAGNGHADVVRLLLAAEADVNAQSQAGSTALMDAALNGHAEVVRLLLAAGADVNAQNQAGFTALLDAAGNGHAEVVWLLLAAEAELPAASRISVAANATIQTVLAELEARKTEFLAAAAAGNLAKINTLIEQPMRDRKLVINQALLALAGSEVDIPAADFERVLAKLLAHGADLNYTESVDGGAIEGKGADAHQQVQEFRTALDLAIMANVPGRVDALLMAGANPELLSDSTKDRLASADVADITLKDNLLIIAKMIQDANMALAMLISPKIFKTFAHSIEESLAAEDNTLDPVLRYLLQWEAQADDRKKRAERARILAIPVPR